jgi:hypothetical protein
MNYPMDNLCKANYFHFITTNSLGEQKYLTTINFKEIYLSDTGAYVVYKAILVASSQPIFSLQIQFLDLIYRKVVLKHNDISIKAFK